MMLALMIGSSPRASFWQNAHIRAQCPTFTSRSMAPGRRLVLSTFSTIIAVMARTASSSLCPLTCLSTSWECQCMLTITLCMTRKLEPSAGCLTLTRPSQTSLRQVFLMDQTYSKSVRFKAHQLRMYLLRTFFTPLSPSLSSLLGKSGSSLTSRLTYWKILQTGK